MVCAAMDQSKCDSSIVREQVMACLADYFMATEVLLEHTLLVDDLGADSLDSVELVMALEEEFETEIPDEDAEKILTIKDAVKYIVERLEKETKAS